MLKTIATVGLVAGLFTGVAAAQDYGLSPNYTTMNLSSGFSNDPRTVRLSSGGSNDASQTIGGSCRGFVSSAPDVRVNYSAGSTFPLIFSVNSSSDTTLVINGPDGRWYCNDDGGNGLNPSYRFSNPQSGQYDVWVGTYGGSSLESATLYVSEISSQ
ncbi:peptidase S1 [Maricaulaceae bacterium NA33B04]|nr:peptidase S1 [Maricaulaceae bacterium NA33B04]